MTMGRFKDQVAGMLGLAVALMLGASASFAAVVPIDATVFNAGAPELEFDEPFLNDGGDGYVPGEMLTVPGVGVLGNVDIEFGSNFDGQVQGLPSQGFTSSTPSSPLMHGPFTNFTSFADTTTDFGSPISGPFPIPTGDALIGQNFFFNTRGDAPIIVLFHTPVAAVGLTAGARDAATGDPFSSANQVRLEAYLADGTIFGAVENDTPSGDTVFLGLADDTEAEVIAGIAVYPINFGQNGLDFYIDNLRFAGEDLVDLDDGPDPGIIPEPMTAMLGMIGMGLLAARRRR